MPREDTRLSGSPAAAGPQSVDTLLVEQIRRGDAEAGSRFIKEHYPGIYRYLLYLTAHPQLAEDLTQETFLQAWRRLDSFDDRLPLRPWLHQIAHREFLQALREQRPQVSLETAGEIADSHGAEGMEAIELREIIRKLPLEEQEIVVLHYLAGYEYTEIARIVGAPVGRVRHRLSDARSRLQRELGEGDLGYLNQAPGAVLRRWEWLPLEALTILEARLSLIDPTSTKGERRMSDKTNAGVSRRRLLEAAGTTAAAVAAAGLAGPAAATAAPRNEAEVIDDRLTRKVTLAAKAMALADLCEQLRSDLGIGLAAGPSVADENVSLFCEKLPLREVMRQLSRPFGYTWLRSGTPGQCRYELVQDLRSALLEEELRNRDRHAALLALEREMQRHRPLLDLSPDEAQSRFESAPPAEQSLLEKLSDYRWGAIQLYFQLAPGQISALHAGEKLTFHEAPGPGEQRLPPEIVRGVLASARGVRVARREGHLMIGDASQYPDGVPAADVAGVRAAVQLWIEAQELGQFTLWGGSGLALDGGWGAFSPLATGTNPRIQAPENARANARFARDPALLQRATVDLTPQVRREQTASGEGREAFPSRAEQENSRSGHVTTADALDTLHRTTGLPIVADYYTRLYLADVGLVRDQPLFDALNRLGDALWLRWLKEGEWLQSRSVGYYDDRRKEVPNRLLRRWTAARRAHGFLPLDALIEIGQLADTQLDAAQIAEGARELFGLEEWELAGHRHLRPHLRFLACLAQSQRQAVTTETGLPFTQLTLAQQQQFASLAFAASGGELERGAGLGAHSIAKLLETTLRVDYTRPGGFEWRVPDPALGEGWPPRRRSPVWELTPAAALAAARRFNPAATEAQILPTERDLIFLYTRLQGGTLYLHWLRKNGKFSHQIPAPDFTEASEQAAGA